MRKRILWAAGEKARLVRLLATPDVLGRLVIGPASKRGDITDRIRWDRTEG